MSGILYIVATPIGNLKDITLRALEVLKSVDLILAEDSRVTVGLLKAYEIVKPIKAFHQHSKNTKWILDELKLGKNIALVSDAGTPGVNDPGGILIEEIVNSSPDVKIVPIPGVSALTTLMSVAGISLENFKYLGFIPHKKGRQTLFKMIAELEMPAIFFESTHRIIKTLEQLYEVAPNKKIVVGRELTKMFETIYRGTIPEVVEKLNSSSIKGEFTVIVY